MLCVNIASMIVVVMSVLLLLLHFKSAAGEARAMGSTLTVEVAPKTVKVFAQKTSTSKDDNS